MPQQTADAPKIPPYRQPSNMNLDFFWKITSKWYFFPLFYILLVLIFSIIVTSREGSYSDWDEVGGIFLMGLYFLPSGLFFFIPELERFGEEGLYLIFPAVFHLFWIISVIVMQILKYKRNRILKWLVITLFILMVLSFAGCTAMVIGEGSSFFRSGFF